MKSEKGSGAIAFVIIILVVLFLLFLITGGNSNDSSKPSSSMKSTYEKTLQKSKDGVPLTETEKRFLDSYIKSGY
ncbi:MAG: hypothetical protein HFJ47_02460 [Clostridia bacterium]|nr:hypothetical protein [Clostridia bacterium]